MWRLRAPLLALLLMQVILLASSGVTATKKPLGKQETCNMKNHMIEYLRNNGVQIYERPQINSKTCLKEWDSFGTCCEVASIKSVISKKIELNNQALLKLTKELESVVPAVKSYYKKYVTDPLAERQKQSSHLGNGISFMTAQPPKIHPFVSCNEENFQKLLKSVESTINPTIIQKQKECVDKFNEVISKSACSICSGRSDDFFSSDSRLAISEPTCRAVLRACGSSWTTMTKIPEAVRLATQEVRKITEGYDLKLESEDPEELGFTMNLDSFITNRNLIPIMKICGNDVAECSFEHVAALCEQFIHIQAPTYIESSQSQIISISLKVHSAKKLFEVGLDEVRTAASNLKRTQAFSLQNLDSLISGVSALQSIQKGLETMSQVWVSAKIQLARLNHLSGEDKSRTKELLSQTNSLIADAYKATKKYLLINHDYLVQITLASLPAERVVLTFMGSPKPNPAVSIDATNVRIKVEQLWSSFNFALEVMRNPAVDVRKKFGDYINGQSFFWFRVETQEDRLTKNLREKIYHDLYEELVGSDKIKQAAVRTGFGMMTMPDARKLVLLRSEKEQARYSFTMETIVVRDRKACLDIGSQTSGVVTFDDSP